MATGTTGIVTVTAPAGEPSPAGTYCIDSPVTPSAGYVRTRAGCSAGSAPASAQWRIYGDTGDPLTRYHVVHYQGYCLTSSDNDLFQNTPPVSKIALAVCSADPGQMWNAPPDVLDPVPLKDISET